MCILSCIQLNGCTGVVAYEENNTFICTLYDLTSSSYQKEKINATGYTLTVSNITIKNNTFP